MQTNLHDTQLSRGGSGELPDVVVVHDHAHGLPHHAEDAPEERVAHEGVVVALVDELGEPDERRLRDHAEEGVEAHVLEGHRDDQLVQERREGEHHHRGEDLGGTHSDQGVVCGEK